MIQFFAPDIATDPTLPETDSRHCVKVLRYREGDMLEVIDGKGHRYTCRLADADPRHAMVEIVNTAEVPLPWDYDLTVAVAPTKHIDRMEWLVEKLTEIGINRFIPLRCEHSERKEVKTERLEKIAVSAMKQSLKAVLPTIEPVTPVNQVIDTFSADQKFIAYCDVVASEAFALTRDTATCLDSHTHRPGGRLHSGRNHTRPRCRLHTGVARRQPVAHRDRGPYGMRYRAYHKPT